MKSETDKKKFREFIKENSHMLSTLGIFSALSFSVSAFVPSYIGLLLSILFAMAVVIFLVEILKDLVETRLFVDATGKLFGMIMLSSVFLLFLHLFLYTYTGTTSLDSLAFYLILAIMIFIIAIVFIHSIFINYGYEIKLSEKSGKTYKFYKFLCWIIFIAAFFISYAIYKNLDSNIKNYIQNNYSLTEAKSFK